MIITRHWLDEFATINGKGYTAKQTRLLGVPWPLQKGWRLAQIGREIPDETAREFERLARMRRVAVMTVLFEEAVNPPSAPPPVFRMPRNKKKKRKTNRAGMTMGTPRGYRKRQQKIARECERLDALAHRPVDLKPRLVKPA